jgi:hypothetical protein
MSPNDFYAAASAAFVVIPLTKFLAHRTRRPQFQRKDIEDMAWWIGHWICVIAALLEHPADHLPPIAPAVARGRLLGRRLAVLLGIGDQVGVQTVREMEPA